jgi:hypothetical protein
LLWACFYRFQMWHPSDMFPPDGPLLNSSHLKMLSPLTLELLTNGARLSSDGHRYSRDKDEFAFDLMRPCGPSALDFVRAKIPLLFWQGLSRVSPDEFDCQDLTD